MQLKSSHRFEGCINSINYLEVVFVIRQCFYLVCSCAILAQFYPTKVPSLSDKTSRKTNAEDTSALGAASTTNIRQKKKHRLESSPLNMDPQRQSDIFPIFCPAF